MKRSRRILGTVCFGGWLFALAQGEATPAAVITPQQIEADWLHPESLRQCAGEVGPRTGGKVTPTQDAIGGCDGVKDGKWGFHTAFEQDPWWQVDLGKRMPLERIVLYNRCDSCGSRNSRIIVSLSDDAKSFHQTYQHDGKTFFGFTDKKPLAAPLKGATARYVRLQLRGKSYFHLDEVEVYATGDGRNIALGMPATQSSVSTWSVAHAAQPAGPPSYPTAKAIERGLRLAADLRGRGVAVDDNVKTLRQLGERLKQLPANAIDEIRQRLYLDARWAARKLALRNPLLDFNAIVFAKAAPTQFPHMSDQFYGWWSRPGGGVFVLKDFKGPQPKLRCLTSDMPPGSFVRPELSYDGKKVLFAYCRFYPHVPELKDKVTKPNLPEDAFYHVYEMNLDGSGRRQLTRGRYDDFDARYLPDGDIVFLSTRKGTFLQCSQSNTAATTSSDLPDSYVRCGGGDFRPVPVFTLHAMDARGGSLRPLSAFENFEWTPAVATDGRILYTRWDYIDRFNGHFFSLWSANPDGTNPQLVYGNYTVRPQVVCEAVPIPNSPKLAFTASAHHSIIGGSLVLLDRNRGTEEAAPIVRLTPEVPFPETEANVGSYYANPFPLAEEHYLVGWSNRKLPPHCRVDNTEQNPVNAMGIYLYDAFGNLNLLHRDPAISSGSPIPVRPRPRPPARAAAVAAAAEASEGSFLLQDIYEGLPGVSRGAVKWLRVVGVPPKVQPHMNKPNLGVSREDPGKFLLGTVPVEADGSAYFRVPSGVSVLFQALDADGLALQTMRSLTYVVPNQTLSCVGCHESRDSAPVAARSLPLAARRAPSRLAPGPSGSWPLRYDQLVQPVLDKLCVSCHRPGSGDVAAAKLDLSPAKSYDSLLNFAGKNLHTLAFEKDRSVTGDMPARKSKLLALFKNGQGHYDTRLDTDSFNRLATWMDLYAQRQGHYSDQQEQQLHELREKLAAMLAP